MFCCCRISPPYSPGNCLTSDLAPHRLMAADVPVPAADRILVETKEMLEEQLDTARKRSEQIVELETAVLKYKQQINDLSLVS